MKRRFQTAAALVLTLAATAASADTSQLAASIGLGADAASTLTLTEIARVKYNAGTRQQDRVGMFAADAGGDAAARSQLVASAGLSADETAVLSLTEIVVAKRNREVRRDDNVQIVVSSRGYPAGGQGARSQLIAATGADAAGEMTLQQLYVAKINREGDRDQRVGVY